MTHATDPAIEELRESPFFVLSGPGGRLLSCQWTAWNETAGRAFGGEFEIVCPETPEAMGSLFGMFEDGRFRMRPAIVRLPEPRHSAFRPFDMAPHLDLDLSWRGTIDDVVETGFDWEMGEDGLLFILDPEEPARDPAPVLRMAA